MVYDPANLDAVGMLDPIAFYKHFRAQVGYVHLKDFARIPGGVKPVACGEGGLDWPKLLTALKDYSGPAMLEYENPEDVADGFRRSLKVFGTPAAR